MNTSLRQRVQCSVALNHYLVARRASTIHGTQQSVLKQKLRQNTSYLQLGGMNNRLYSTMTIFAQQFNICSFKCEGEYGAYHPSWLRVLQLTASPLTTEASTSERWQFGALTNRKATSRNRAPSTSSLYYYTIII